MDLVHEVVLVPGESLLGSISGESNVIRVGTHR